MCKIFNITVLALLLTLSLSSYLEFPLERSPYNSKYYQKQPLVCKNQTTLNQQADYRQICFEKDISYFIPFINNQQHVFMSVDLTAPIGWIKSSQCKIEGTGKKCSRVQETFAEEMREIKHSIAKKFHKKKNQLKENAIIEGSSQIIRGQIQKGQNVSFIAKDSSRLNNFFELILLGLFIYGQHDFLQLQNTNFINATEISSNLDCLGDGAISMRFDQTSENSFLNQIFSYVKATEKAVGIYLGNNHTITIGDMTAKYVQNGFSDIQWIDMPQDEGFGLLPRLSFIGMDDRSDDTEEGTPEELTAVLTLSASYIGLPESVINTIIKKDIDKEINCTINNKTSFVECTASSKKKLEKMLLKSLFFSFNDKNINIPISSLTHESIIKKKMVLKIKRTFNNRVILGEPVFLQHYIVLDYSKNRFGFANKRTQMNDFFMDIVTLVRFLCFVFVVGCSFILCFQPCRRMMKTFGGRALRNVPGTQGKRLKQYSPIQENPYDELKGKIQEAFNNADREQVEGI